MKKLKGPELKLPELKAPAFLADIYYDMRDRRLLPLVALVLVAIGAVPFLLGGDEEAFVAPPAESLSSLGSTEKTSTLTVVEATPGLRDYRKRLSHLSPTNPFKQRYTGLPPSAKVASQSVTSEGGGGAESPVQTSSGGPEAEETETVSPGSSGSSPSSGSPGSTSPGASPGASGKRFFGYRPDIRFGMAGSQQLTEYNKLPLGKLLPEHDPVLLFVGVSEDGKRAIFDIPGAIAYVSGSGQCIPNHKTCKVIELREGQAVTIVTGAPNRTFRLAVTKIDFTEVDQTQRGRPSATENRKALDPVQDFIK